MGQIFDAYAKGAELREQRASKREMKKQRDQALEMEGYSFDEEGTVQRRPNSSAELQQLQIEESVALAKSLQGKLSAGDTDRAFEDFSQTGNANDLQRAIDNDPNIKKAWAAKGVLLVNNIDFSNDEQLLRKSGFVPTSYDTEEKRATIKKSAYKIYNGKDWSIGLANRAAAETGVSKRQGSRRTQPIRDNHKALVDLIGGTKSSPNTAKGHKYEDIINTASKKHNVPANLIASMIAMESSGRPRAVSPKGAGGLMQIMPDTAKDLGLVDVFDPAQNIEAGTKYMSQLLDRYEGDTDKALAAYNAGMGNVDKYGGIPPFPETQKYVSKVKEKLDAGESFSGSSADNAYDIILEHRRGIALAAKGSSVAEADRERVLAQRESSLKTQTEQRKAGQEQEKINISREELELKRSEAEKVSLTPKEKDFNAAEKIEKELYSTYKSKEDFYTSSPVKGSEEYRNLKAKALEIEKITGTEPSEADKKEIKDLHTLISLSGTIDGLTSAETGLIDKTLHTLEQYFSNNVEGAAATTAWNAFRNIYIAMMSGKAVTPAEAKRNAEAFGTLGRKFAPALAMFEISLQQVETRLNSVSQNMLPVPTKMRLGKSKEDLVGIQKNISSTLREIRGLVDTPEKTKANEEKILSTLVHKQDK